MSRYLVISTSLNPGSRSRPLAEKAVTLFEQRGQSAEYLDLRQHDLPVCDASQSYGHPSVGAVSPLIAAARGIIVATPIYNYDVNAAAKNLLELTGDAWSEKVVGFICAAGGHGSYMSIVSFANSLMLDYRCVIVPRFVYSPRAEDEDKSWGQLAITERLELLVHEVVHFVEALHPRSAAAVPAKP